jgi:hypothetical protein
MFKIAGTLPVKTRLPFVAWALAGLVTIFSLVTSFEIPTFNHAEQASTSATGLSTPLSRICSKYWLPSDYCEALFQA